MDLVFLHGFALSGWALHYVGETRMDGMCGLRRAAMKDLI